MNGCYQLITHSSTGKIEITREGEHILSNIKHKIIVVAVTGPYRTGKSFILNSILGINVKGFGVGNDVRACTQGIWMHIKIVDEKVFVFLDVEGFGSTSRSSKDDAKLFALGLLCSSLVIYNSVGVINENKINSLALALSYCEIITSQSQGLTSFPKLLWVLRDFVLELVDHSGNSLSAPEYLENVLKEDVKGKSNKNYAKMRESIMRTFPDRDCITLPRPVEDESMLQNLDNTPESELRPSFVKGLNKIKKIVLDAKYKQYQNKSLRGKDLIELLIRFVSALNSEEIPDIPSTWDDIVKKEYLRITEMQIDEITKAKNLFQTKIPIEDDEIINYFKSLKEKSDNLIIDCYFRNEKYTYESIAVVTKLIEEEVEDLITINKKSCLDYNISLLNSLFSLLFFNIENNEYKSNFDKLETDWANAMEEYETRSKGSAKFAAINEFSRRNKKSDLAKILQEIFIQMKTQISELKCQEKYIESPDVDLLSKNKEEIKTEIAYNRYKIQQFNLQVKVIQKKILRQL